MVKTSKKQNKHEHKVGDICYDCGYGVNTISWKCITITLILGIAFGLFLAGKGNLSIEKVFVYLSVVIGIVALAVLVDTRKIIINNCFKKK